MSKKKNKKSKQTKLSPWQKHVKKSGGVVKAAKTWSKKAGKPKTKTKNKTIKQKVKTMPKKKSGKGKKKGGGKSQGGGKSRSSSSMVTKGLLLAGGAVIATGVMDYAVTGELPTVKTMTDRAQGVINKLGNKEILYPILVGGFILPKYKLPAITKGNATVLGLGMIGAAAYAAATTPGSPGTPIGQHAALHTMRVLRPMAIDINRRR